MKPPFIGKRLVFHFSGYDPTPPDRAYRRFVRELRRFEETWSVTASASKAQVGSDEAWWDIVTAGPNWRVETRYVFVRWDDVIEANRSQPMWRRVPHALLVFLDFVAAGAFWRYLRTNWRYALFFLYPYVLFGTFLVIGSYVGLFCTELSGSRIVGAIAALMVVTALLQWPGRRLYLPFLFDDWIFSANYIRRSNRILDDRLDHVARGILDAVRRRDADEILVTGHSLGVVLAIETLDRALKLDSALGCSGTPVALLSLGSSALKIGLHPAAARFRAAVQRVAAAPGILWAEYQAIIDVMNFYKVDPAAAMGLTTTGRPLVHRMIHIRQMLDPSAYRRLRRSFFKVHNQFIRANTRRTFYDYFLLVCGPLSVERHVHSPAGVQSELGPDGALLSVPTDHERELDGALAGPQ